MASKQVINQESTPSVWCFVVSEGEDCESLKDLTQFNKGSEHAIYTVCWKRNRAFFLPPKLAAPSKLSRTKLKHTLLLYHVRILGKADDNTFGNMRAKVATLIGTSSRRLHATKGWTLYFVLNLVKHSRKHFNLCAMFTAMIVCSVPTFLCSMAILKVEKKTLMTIQSQGRPETVFTRDLIEKVREIIAVDSNVTCKTFAEEFALSKATYMEFWPKIRIKGKSALYL